MPLRRLVDTLRKVCMSLIIENLANYSMEELRNIPWQLSEELIQYFDDVKINPTDVDYYYRNRLMNPNMKKLRVTFDDLELFPTDIMRSVLNVCKKLTSLTLILPYDGKLNQIEYLHLIRSIPNVVILQLKRTILVNDDILQEIGDNCPNLEILIALCESEVTDIGIRRLCRSKSGGSRIKHLELSFTSNVTGDGYLLALLSLAKLKMLDCHSFVCADAFVILHNDFLLNAAQIPLFQLYRLPSIAMGKIKENGILDFILKCCPNVSNLDLYFDRNISCSLNELKKCAEHVSFEITIYQCEIFMSILNVIGEKITILHLEKVSVNVKMIGLNCLNLNKLVLSRVWYLPTDYTDLKDGKIAFINLHYLHIIYQIPIHELNFLLKNCLDLEELIFSVNKNITDDVIISILREVNPLKHLTNLGFDYCKRVSKMPILEVLRLDNQLKKLSISISNNYNITESDLAEIKSFISLNNYCISMSVAVG